MRSLKAEFFEKMAKKPFMSFLRKWFSDQEFSDVHIAKCLSSMITHCLIEMDKNNEVMYKALDIPFQVDTLAEFLNGRIGSADVKELYRDKFFKYIKR